MSFKCEKHGWEHHNTMCPICFQVTTSSTTGDTLLSSQPAEGEKSAKEISDIERCKYELLVEEYFKIPLTSSTNILSINDHTLVDFALFVHQTLQPSTTPSGEGMAEALRLLDTASNLVGNPGTNISSSTDLACDSWQEKYKKFIASISPGVEDGSGWVKGGKGYIVCAAIQYFVDDKEVIVCGLRHNNCIGTYYDLTGKQTNSELEQGFLTSKGRFVNRIEAGEIALSCGQIKEMKCYGGKMLDSSDLYHSSPLPTPLGVEDNQTKKQ